MTYRIYLVSLSTRYARRKPSGLSQTIQCLCLPPEVQIFRGRHFDRSVILPCIWWYLTYSLSLRDLEEMMVERGISVDHATVNRRTIYYAPLLLEAVMDLD
ncbi:hypothetical protein SAMN02927923_03847 [Microvirga guangxiensis]|uniref:Transposase n=1 Tax=Microvirga guangxiensis TaxID=549386 RepID=A0A1G5L354_9HYPH|nr:hypothetical protein SAMN02927923_03847 [Microvirga guangxiensis]